MENQRTILVIVCPLGKDHPSLLPGGRGTLKIDFSKLASIVANNTAIIICANLLRLQPKIA